MAGVSSAASMVVVWEWLNEFGNWRPYEPHVCSYLEQNANQKGRFYMGNADPTLTKYIVDLAQMHQVRHTTGKYLNTQMTKISWKGKNFFPGITTIHWAIIYIVKCNFILIL